jgi:hypothetical protein
MRIKLFFVGCMLLLFSSSALAQVWTNTSVPWAVSNDYVSSMATFGADLFVGTGNYSQTVASEVWRFDGTNWTNTNGPWGVAYDSVDSLAVYGPNLYAAIYSMSGSIGQVWKCDGTNWTNTNGPWVPGVNGVSSLAVYGGALYAGTARPDISSSAQVWKYDGTNWTNTNIPWSSGNIIALKMAVYGGNLYVGSESSSGAAAEVWQYDGATWVNTNAPWVIANNTVTGLVSNGGNLYAGTYNIGGAQLWRYNGVAWSAVTPAWVSGSYIDLTAYNNTLFACTTADVRSYDGTTWADLAVPPSTDFAGPMAGYGSSLYLGTVPSVSGPAQVWETSAGQSAATAVPTMNGWGMLLFMIVSGIGALHHIRRKKVTR